MKEVLDIFSTYGPVCGGGALIIMTVLEISKKSNTKPWTWIFRRLGRAVNGELIERVEALEEQAKSLGVQAKKLENTAGEQKAINCRSRILRFGDEVTRKLPHSREYFDQILDDITEYEHYCQNHPEFTNNKTRLTVERIQDCYRDRLDKNDFL